MKAGKTIVRGSSLAILLLAVCGRAAGLTLEAGHTEVVLDPAAPSATRFAATELTNFLSRVFGASVPVVTAPTAGMTQIVLGTNAWSAAEGLDPAALEPDSFLIRATADRLYLCGLDGGCSWFEKSMEKGQSYGMLKGTWATLFAVYEFLERYADCRFYFPGELGEIVPRANCVTVPFGTTTHVPDMLIRKYYQPENDLYHGAHGWIAGNEYSFTKGQALNWLRLRMGSFDIPCGHGINRYYFLKRFGKEHPEYFALRKDGTRCTDYEGYESSRWGMLCFSSAVTNVLYEDIKAYFLGKTPSSRRIHRGWNGEWEWPDNLRGGRYADIMPNDCQCRCECAECRKLYRPECEKTALTEIVWGYTRDIARRLIDEKVPGCVTQMAYADYARIPDFDLPTNVMVMVAKTGPFSIRKPELLARDNAEIRRWKEKAGGVWIWTYPNKYGELNVPGVPSMTPHAWGDYYKQIAPDVFGIFAESECDRFFFHHLCYYLFSRICWDTSTDVNEVLDEYYSRMYGAAAPEAKRFCEELEDVFLGKMVGQIANTPAGPAAKAPTLHEIWTEIYSPRRLDRWRELLQRGAAKLKKGSLEARRFALFSDELWGTMRRACDDYLDRTDVRRNVERFRKSSPARNLVDWEGVWYGTVRDPDVKIVTDASVRVISTNGTATALYYLDGRSAPALKRNARYRLSFFIKGKNIVPTNKAGGAGITVCDAFNKWFPRTAGIVGTFDWMHQSFEFTTDPETNDRCLSYLYLRLSQANGTAWFDGVRLEELPEQVVKPESCAVVVDPDSPKQVLLSAKELSCNLGRRFGLEKVPVRRSPDGVKFAFVVGTNAWSAAAGVRTDDLKPGQFRVKSVPGAVYICGNGEAERYGIYGFLRREADCAFFFPGELGEVVPTAADLPLQRLDYVAGLDELHCYVESRKSPDGFLRHLGFCVTHAEPMPASVRPAVFESNYMTRLFGATSANWHMRNFLKDRTRVKSVEYALAAAEKVKDPLVVKRIELFRDRLAEDANRKRVPRYGFTFFRGNGEDGIFLATSPDGLNWAEANGGNPILPATLDDKITRDPSVCVGPDGLYHMVFTTSWKHQGFGIAHSPDLKVWSNPKFIPVNADWPTAKNTWAPEICWDEEGGRYFVVWATSESSSSGRYHRQYYVTTRDFKSWSPRSLFYDPGHSVIDAFPFRFKGRWMMVIKDETHEPVAHRLSVVRSKGGAFGPWEREDPPFTDPTKFYAEGPTALELDDGRWVVYFDCYNKGCYGARITDDFKNFQETTFTLPPGIRHGTAFRLKDAGTGVP